MLIYMQRWTMVWLCLVFSWAFFFLPTAHAQLSTGVGTISIALSPAYPDPGQMVTATLNDYAVDTTGASIAWYINGKRVPAVTDQRSISFPAGALGTKTVIKEVSTLPNGATMTATAVAPVVRVDLLVEANTIAPAFYRGRTVPAIGSIVRVTALPFDGSGAAASNYDYTWTVNDSVINGGAVHGQNAIQFAAGFSRDLTVTVQVTNYQGATVGKKSIMIPLQKPHLLFYRIDPLSGIAREAMSNPYTMTAPEIQVQAVPYGIDRSLLSQSPYIAWKLNGSPIQNQSSIPEEITLRKTASTTGSFLLDFHIRNLQQLLQGVEDSITINF